MPAGRHPRVHSRLLLPGVPPALSKHCAATTRPTAPPRGGIARRSRRAHGFADGLSPSSSDRRRTMLVLRVCLPLARYLPGLWQPRRWAESVAESSLQAGRGCGFPALSLPPVKEGSVLCSKCSKRFLSLQWRLQSFFSHCSARNPLGPFLPRVTKISIPDGLIAHRSCGRNATGRKSLIVARNVARHGTALGRPKIRLGL